MTRGDQAEDTPSKLRPLVDLQEVAEAEVWLVRAPSSMDMGQLHETVLGQAAETTGFAPEVKKHSEQLTIVGATKGGQSKAVPITIKGTVTFTEVVTNDGIKTFEIPRVAPPVYVDTRKIKQEPPDEEAAVTLSPRKKRKRRKED